MKSILCFVIVACVFSGQAGAQPTSRPYAGSYLVDLKTKDFLQLLPPPPTAGDTRDATDRAIFKSSRSFENSPRWSVAQSDNDLSASGILSAFSCSLNMVLTPETAPQLGLLISHITEEANAIVGQLKDHYERKRPFLVDEGPICLSRSAHLVRSFDYPSGHATDGWAAGLVLAELWPKRETQIFARAREFGESRAFCGVHNVSAIEAGRTVGGAVVAMLHASASFRRDLEIVRAEAAHLGHKHAVKAETCLAQAETLKQNLYR